MVKFLFSYSKTQNLIYIYIFKKRYTDGVLGTPTTVDSNRITIENKNTLEVFEQKIILSKNLTIKHISGLQLKKIIKKIIKTKLIFDNL